MVGIGTVIAPGVAGVVGVEQVDVVAARPELRVDRKAEQPPVPVVVHVAADIDDLGRESDRRSSRRPEPFRAFSATYIRPGGVNPNATGWFRAFVISSSENPFG